MLWVCEGCGARYAEPLTACPQCGATARHADYEEEDMPKITRTGGPSNGTAPDATESEPEAPALPPPPVSAPKAEHVQYATDALGVPADEAAAKTKAELIEQAKSASSRAQDG